MATEKSSHDHLIHPSKKTICIVQFTSINFEYESTNYDKKTDKIINDPVVCFYNNSNCGALIMDGEKFRSDNFKPYVIVGPFCEYHYATHMNGIVVRNKIGNELLPTIVNYTAIPHTTAVFPVWSFQPINSSKDYFIDLLSNTIVATKGKQEDLDALAKSLSNGTMVDGRIKNNYLNLFVRFTNAFSGKLKELGRCWKQDGVHVYFTEKFVTSHRNNGLIQNIMKDLPQTKIDNFTAIFVPLKYFCVFDVLLIKSFEPSTITNEDSFLTTSHIHNIQIIDGMYFYATGAGLNNEYWCPTEKLYYSTDYPENVNKILSKRHVNSNQQPLVLDMHTYDKQKKTFFSKEDQKPTNININTLASVI